MIQSEQFLGEETDFHNHDKQVNKPGPLIAPHNVIDTLLDKDTENVNLDTGRVLRSELAHNPGQSLVRVSNVGVADVPSVVYARSVGQWICSVIDITLNIQLVVAVKSDCSTRIGRREERNRNVGDWIVRQLEWLRDTEARTLEHVCEIALCAAGYVGGCTVIGGVEVVGKEIGGWILGTEAETLNGSTFVASGEDRTVDRRVFGCNNEVEGSGLVAVLSRDDGSCRNQEVCNDCGLHI